MIELIQANSLSIPLEDNSIQCMVTSPPYYGLRDYGVDGQIGLEQSPEEYVAKMVAVFRYEIQQPITIGWQPACDCGGEPVPCVVLDPFCGSGTTLLVARKLGRSAVGLDLSYTYLHDQARKRLELDKLKAWIG